MCRLMTRLRGDATHGCEEFASLSSRLYPAESSVLVWQEVGDVESYYGDLNI